MGKRGKFGALCVILQLIFLILFGVFVKYTKMANAKYDIHSKDDSKNTAEENEVAKYYSMFQDVHVMIFVGFGFLMTFLKRYGFSSVGMNFFVSCLVIQWATLVNGFLHLHDNHIEVSVVEMLTSDFACAAVLISFGAVLGKLSPTQMIVMSVLEIVVFAINEWLGIIIFQAVDIGGSMFVHAFGAYFGIAMSRTMWKKEWLTARPKEGSAYHSDLFAMIGTLFLWMFWPSFNSALAPGDDQQRAVLNTYFCLAACCFTSFAISSLTEHDKFDMVHIQNATLAGGVAVGAVADLMIEVWGAMTIGIVTAIISVLGYRYLSPWMDKHLKLSDTCGVHNLHGLPAVIAGLGSIVACAVATEDMYGLSLYEIFPARTPHANTTEYARITQTLSVDPGLGRTAGTQAAYQAAALAVTIIVAVIGGMATGFILRMPIWDPLELEELHDDSDYWVMPDEGLPGHLGFDDEKNGGTESYRHKKDDEMTKV